MQIFFYAKTQLACLVILVYMSYLYIVEGCYLNKVRRRNGCNLIYDVLFILGETTLLFDGTTAITVNYLEQVPPILNCILHLCFFLSIQAFISTFAFYTFSFTGTSAFITFFVILLYGIIAFSHFIRNKAALPRRRKTAFISWLLVSLAIFIIQVFFRETLVSALGITMLLLATYECIETPTLRALELTHTQMIIGFATLVENKDGSTGGHINRTSNYVALLTETLRNMKQFHKVFTNDYIAFLKRAAPMHDIGKIGIPDEI